MSTKTADKKKIPASAPVAAKPADSMRDLANECLVHAVHQAIVTHGEPAKIADIARTIGDDAIPILIAALSDSDESVAFAAHAALLAHTDQTFSPDQKQWQKWWQDQQNAPTAKP